MASGTTRSGSSASVWCSSPPATTFGGWGQLAYRAARRLYEEEQLTLIVGVRAGADGRHWVCADARTRSAAP